MTKRARQRQEPASRRYRPYDDGRDGEPGAEIYAAAAKKEQAQVLFRDAVSMVEQSPQLAERISRSGENPVWQLTYRSRKKRSDKRFFKPISSDKAQSGPRPSCALCDEVHEHPNRDTIDMLERGFKFREQPLLVMATNSGSDRQSVCWEEHKHAVEVAAGIVQDDTTFAFVCSLDEGGTIGKTIRPAGSRPIRCSMSP